MSLLTIIATFQCDACNQRLSLELDSSTPSEGPSLMEEAEAQLTGHVHDMHLCHRCHVIALDVTHDDDGEYASKAEILAAIDKALRKNRDPAVIQLASRIADHIR